MSTFAKFLLVAGIAALIASCAGRDPDLVDVVQAKDSKMDCHAIFAEVQANNAQIQRLAKENGWKVAQNVAAGVAGFAIPVLWFGMDWKGAASKEAHALQARQQYLGQLAARRGCGGS